MRKKWTSEEVELLRKLVAEGIPYYTIAQRLGRTAHAVSTKYIKSSWSPAKKAEYNKREMERRTWYVRPYQHATTRCIAPPEKLQEREQRNQAPRTLTGTILGDPPIGFSALEKRA